MSDIVYPRNYPEHLLHKIKKFKNSEQLIEEETESLGQEESPTEDAPEPGEKS